MKKMSASDLYKLYKLGLFPRVLTDGWLRQLKNKPRYCAMTEEEIRDLDPFMDRMSQPFVLAFIAAFLTLFSIGANLLIVHRPFTVWGGIIFIVLYGLVVGWVCNTSIWKMFVKDFQSLTASHPRGFSGVIIDSLGGIIWRVYDLHLTELAECLLKIEAGYGKHSKEANEARVPLYEANEIAARFGIVDGDVTKYFQNKPATGVQVASRS